MSFVTSEWPEGDDLKRGAILNYTNERKKKVILVYKHILLHIRPIIIILLTDIGCKMNENDYERVRILIEEKNLERGSLKTKTNLLHLKSFSRKEMIGNRLLYKRLYPTFYLICRTSST